MCSPFVG